MKAGTSQRASSHTARRWRPSLSPPPKRTSSPVSFLAFFFSSPTLNPVTRGLKEGRNPDGSLRRTQPHRPSPSLSPTEARQHPDPVPTAPTRGASARERRRSLVPSLAPGGAAAPRPSPWSPLAAEWGLRKGRSVPRGAEAAFAPAPAPCGSGVSESGPWGAQDGGGGRGGGGGPSPATGGR